MNTIRAVLFDFDGTLTLPGSIDFAGIKKAIRCPGDRPILEFIEGLPSAADQRRAWQVLKQFEKQAAWRSRPNKGAEELVRFLKRRRIRRGILTRNRHASVEMALKNFAHVRLADFNVIITRDHVQRSKPDPEGVLLAARRLRVPAATLLMVGDYRYDIEAGQRAGAPTIFLESHLTTRRPDPPADFVVCTLSEVADIIDRLNRGRKKAHQDTK
ncbi:MAG: HAD family hydrolase [Verrucomicrobia bacterium]|nr:HAD family hydrolase [Verrucomicrobiota bacterium]MBU1735140.1 HAD family hydrolase [Verrucomicrobiota bacterium]MBU1855997.1 HAD family hydrolase [Verrucomicrobiota bacterium]